MFNFFKGMNELEPAGHHQLASRRVEAQHLMNNSCDTLRTQSWTPGKGVVSLVNSKYVSYSFFQSESERPRAHNYGYSPAKQRI
jgi:hypothetical protein